MPKKSSTRKRAVKKATKRIRKSQPLFAEVQLGILSDLLGNDPKAKVTVSRNFVLDLQRAQLEKEAADKLGIK